MSYRNLLGCGATVKVEGSNPSIPAGNNVSKNNHQGIYSPWSLTIGFEQGSGYGRDPLIPSSRCFAYFMGHALGKARRFPKPSVCRVRFLGGPQYQLSPL